MVAHVTSEQIDLVIVGAGAAGLAAGIFAGVAKPEGRRSICLLEGAKTLGAKILVSGGGRCNVTHERVTPTDFFGNRHIIKNVLAAFSVEQARAWFESMGVALKREDTGKLFPVTDQARTVLHALVHRCRDLNVDIRTGCRVSGIERFDAERSGFTVRCGEEALQARRVILATGGRSLPRSGSDGGGYALVRKLGHRVTATVPALVPLVLAEGMFHRALSGLSQEVELTTTVNGRAVDRRWGSLLWTHFGISGPIVMDASRFWTLARAQGEAVELHGNFLGGDTSEQARAWFLAEAAEHPRRSVKRTLAQRVPERFAEALCGHLGVNAETASAQVTRAERARLCGALTGFVFPVARDRGWNYAEVTAGGVPLEEIAYRTMESKVVPGLYLVGEILDCDGRIGGFNFQWAWATGYLAGRAAAEAIR